MSSSKRQPSKQKRASQNRAERAARNARRDAAAAPATGGTSSGADHKSLLGRLRGSSFSLAGAAPGGKDSSTTRRTGGAAERAAVRAAQPIGYRAALSSVLAAGAGLILCLVFIKVPVTVDGDLYTKERLVAEWSDTALRAAMEAPRATAGQLTDRIKEWAPDRDKGLLAQALWPYSAFIILPVIGSALGLRAVSRRRPGRIVSRAMFATLLGAVLTQGLFLIFVPSILALGVAMFQIRKYESSVAAADHNAGGDVIEAEVVKGDSAERG